MKFHVLTIAALGLTLAACGGPQNSDPADTEAPVLIETQPATGSTAVSVNQKIELTFDEPVVLDDAQLRLTRRGSAGPVPADILVDENVVIIHALEPLSHGKVYTLSMSGIADPSGNESADASIDFRTTMNPVDFQVSYSGGVVYSISDYEIDSNGYLVGYDRLNDPGSDAEWLTSDDLLSDYYVWTRDAEGQQETSERYNDPGADMVWHTSDDVLDSVIEYEHTSDGFLASATYRTDAGPDAVFGTADDAISTVSQYLFDSNGWPTRFVSLGPGADGQFFTGDDEPYFYYDYRRDSDGRILEFRTAGSAGADGTWFTEDDFDTAMLYSYDSQGRQTQTTESYDAGPDGAFATPDDVISYTAVAKYDSQGRQIQAITRNALDEVTYHADLQRDADGNLTTWIQYLDVGPDAEPFTDDDVIDVVTETSYDAAGNRIESTRYVDAGTDSVWFTGDDVPARTQVFADFDG